MLQFCCTQIKLYDMASFIQRRGVGGQRVWQAQIRRRGHPVQIRTFDRKAEAEAWARQLEGEMDRGVFVSRVEAEGTTLAELLARYQREITPQKRGAAMERSHIRVISQDPIARCFISTMTGKILAGYRDRRLKIVSASTLNRELNILSHVFSTAVKEWHIHLPFGNPVALIRRPRVDDKRNRRLNGDEEQRLLKAADSYGGEIGSIIRFAIETGMRRGEIAAMQWEHLDRKSRVLLIPETKAGTPRSVPLSKVAIAALSGVPRRLDGRVFSAHPNSISRAFERVCELAGIEGLTFHDLRHEATSRLFEKGLNPMEVATITGHKTLQMLKRYTHLRAEDLVGRLG